MPPEGPWREIAELMLLGEFETVADRLAVVQQPEFEAYARCRAAKKLLEQGRPGQADEQLERALAFYRSVGATRYIREAEMLLARTGAEVAGGPRADEPANEPRATP